jgi:hypothetical protein
MPHHTGTNNCIETLKSVMCYTIQAQIIVSNFGNYKVPHHTGTNNYINKNVFMVKLSNFSWQTHVNVHIRVQFVHGCHIQGYTWVIHVHVIIRCYASFVSYIFSGTSKYAMLMFCSGTTLY